MTYAQIENGIVVNVIVADEEFANAVKDQMTLVAYDEANEDDAKVARIGELCINGLFVTGNQAVNLGLMSKDEVLSMGVEYIEPVKDTVATKVEEV